MLSATRTGESYRLPTRFYAGNGEWLITPEEARHVLDVGYVTIDGERSPVSFVREEGLRVRVRCTERADLDAALANGDIPTA